MKKSKITHHHYQLDLHICQVERRLRSDKVNDHDGRDAIPQRAGTLIPQVLKLLVLEAEQEHVVNSIRNAFDQDDMQVPTTVPSSSSSSSSSSPSSKEQEDDPFLDSLRYLKGRVMLAS